MALKKTPVNGMKDIEPEEMDVRMYVESVIIDTYTSYGFIPIETPCMEDIRNLMSKQGGENEKLIFKVLKRGEKLKLDQAETENDLVDYGMRYDLTVPLCRYYANHSADLPTPFKALQIGNVWRADRPQRGRYRQFKQCDIDIIGDGTALAEIDLILATTEVLGRIGFADFEIRINERRILKAMADYCGFPDEGFDSLCITLDKMDKIGMDGVAAELQKEGFAKESIDSYITLLDGIGLAEDGFAWLMEQLGDLLPADVIDRMAEIFEAVGETKKTNFELVFDPTLVRGMSYYTGTIFEIAMPDLGISCGGGGRYDKMVGQFTGHDVPACGFSIGFERIIMLLMESGFHIPTEHVKLAYLMERDLSVTLLTEVIESAQKARENGDEVYLTYMNKNKKFQKEQLEKAGYEIVEFYNTLDQRQVKGDLPWQNR
ncbi:MAG: histidine--tRNA ligase [Lachnospiraceae bacterium]|nr:histidine--tRNA ligase [Lachnospiraceae bacterium]